MNIRLSAHFWAWGVSTNTRYFLQFLKTEGCLMADSRKISGSVVVEQENRYAVAFKLMEKIGQHEYAKESEQASRDYWLKLFVQCAEATYGTLPPNMK
jgi:hypothetical protein